MHNYWAAVATLLGLFAVMLLIAGAATAIVICILNRFKD